MERMDPRPRPRRTVGRRAGAAALLHAVAVAVATVLAVPAMAQPQARPGSQKALQEEAARKRRLDEAMRLHDEARALYEAGEYRKAITKLEQALSLDPNGRELVYNLALIHEKLADVDAAERYYRAYLEMETDATLRERTQRALKRIEGAKRELAAKPAGTVEPEAGPAAPPAPQPSQSRGVDRGAAARPAATRPIGPWVWITGGLSASALVVGNVFAISALAKSPGDDATTGNDVGVDDLRRDAEAAHRRAVIADVSFIVCVVAGTAAALLYLSTPVHEASTAATTGRVSPRDGFSVRF